MAENMSLERVRDAMLSRIEQSKQAGHAHMWEWIRAIDAELTSREAKGEAVAFRIVGPRGPYPWVDIDALESGESPELIVGEKERVEYAYSGPAAQEAAKPVEQPRGADIWFEDANDRDAWRYRRLRSAPVGVPGVPCIAIPASSTSGAYVNGDHADAAVDEAEMPKDDAVVAYIETMPNGNQGLVWADHPANTVGHIFTPLVIGGQPKPEQVVGDGVSWISRTSLPRVNPAQMVRIAQNYARVDAEHAYTKVPNFVPHDWVVAAMCAAYDAGRQNIIDGTHTNGYTPEAIESVRRIFDPRPAVATAAEDVLKLDPDTNECSPDPVVRKAFADGYDVGFAHGKGDTPAEPLTDEVGEPITQKPDKALGELSNAVEDVESGKHPSAILSFLRGVREYIEDARDDIAALASQGDVVAVSELRALCDEWESESKDMEAPQPYREACRCFAGDLSAILNRGGK